MFYHIRCAHCPRASSRSAGTANPDFSQRKKFHYKFPPRKDGIFCPLPPAIFAGRPAGGGLHREIFRCQPAAGSHRAELACVYPVWAGVQARSDAYQPEVAGIFSWLARFRQGFHWSRKRLPDASQSCPHIWRRLNGLFQRRPGADNSFCGGGNPFLIPARPGAHPNFGWLASGNGGRMPIPAGMVTNYDGLITDLNWRATFFTRLTDVGMNHGMP